MSHDVSYLLRGNGGVSDSLDIESTKPRTDEKLRSSVDYRADIDGLRAVAVLLVMIYHAGLSFLPGGFIGVDIFFVISGYLTSLIILKALDAGRFSLAVFYSRRIWRLQPAVLALLLCTLVIAAVLYLPEDFVAFLKSEKYTSLLLANQYFAKATDGYASADAATLLLMHTWSLSVEWQWYLILPIGILLLDRVVSRRKLAIVCVILTLVALGISLYVTKMSEGAGYYYFSGRIFELMLGCCVAVFSINRTLQLPRAFSTVVALISFAVIAYCSLQDIPVATYPDYHAAVVCLAVAALIYVGATSLTSVLLTWAPLVSIGLISYSLYLWHWPVIAVINYIGIDKTPTVIAVYFLLTFGLAVISYLAVERPFRHSKLSFSKTVIFMMVFPAVLLSALYGMGKSRDGWPARFDYGNAGVLSRLENAESPNRGKCLDGVSDGSDARCLMGDRSSESKALMIGDSFSNQEWGFIDTLAKDAGFSVMAQAFPACLALPDVYLYDWWKYKDILYTKCHDAVAQYYELVKKGGYKYVIIGQVWESYVGTDKVVSSIDDERTVELSKGRLQEALFNALKIIADTGATPVIVKSNFAMPPGINDCLYQAVKFRGLFGSDEKAKGCERRPWNGEEDQNLIQLMAAAKAAFPELIIIDPKDAQCHDGSCLTAIDGVPVYRDIGHVTDFASYSFGQTYLREKGNPFGSAQ
ncbi:acyltransferase family protein [Pseudomonas sp. NPDC086566]|uniref:acyltransferase family protein n=1 Tax=Pseudomonas sp. NPDC086566 TaxID=3390647 RepID=UPI003CFD5F8E